MIGVVQVGILFVPILHQSISANDLERRPEETHAKYGLALKALIASAPKITKNHTLGIISSVYPIRLDKTFIRTSRP